MPKKTTTQKADIVRKQDDIERRAAARTGIPKETIKTAFNACWEAICEELENGNAVKMHGKGLFYLSKRSPRMGRNPATGVQYQIPAREAMAFQTSPAYAKKLHAIRAKKAAPADDLKGMDTINKANEMQEIDQQDAYAN